MDDDRAEGVLRLGTRGSRLALAQAGAVARELEGACGGRLRIETVVVRTRGDGDRTPLSALAGVGVFSAELRRALLDGRVDLAVHSHKDLPVGDVPGLSVVCVPRREDPRDALCARDGLTVEALPAGARVGTGSPRRAAQILASRPDVEIVDIRGNVPTRLSRVRGLEVRRDEPAVRCAGPDSERDLDAVVLAMAGLRRLGLEGCVAQVLDPDLVLPAPAQGALAVEARNGEESQALMRAVAAVEDVRTRLAVVAERTLMARLGAGCAAPVGALGRVVESGELRLRAAVYSAEGRRRVGCELSARLDPPGCGTVDSAAALGARAAQALLDGGAARIVDLRAGTPRRHGQW